MTEYWIGLFALALLCGAVELLAPAAMGQYVKWMSSLCLLCALIIPLVQLATEGKGLPDRLQSALDEWLSVENSVEDDFHDQWQEEFVQLDLSMAEASVRTMLAERFFVEAADLSVRITPDEKKEKILNIRIALSGGAIWVNTHEMESYIQATFGCECIIYIE